MVEKVEAFKTSDGLVFDSELAATSYEARNLLRGLFGRIATPGGSDTEWADFLVEHWESVHAALYPVFRANQQGSGFVTTRT